MRTSYFEGHIAKDIIAFCILMEAQLKKIYILKQLSDYKERED